MIAYKHLRNCTNILDIGCGIGRFISLFDRNKITGLDSNPNTVKQLMERDFKVLELNALDIDKLEEKYDGIHCSHLMEHLYPDQVHELLIKIDSLLVTNGVLVIRGPLLSKYFYDDLTHIKPYNPFVFIRYLTYGTEQQSTKRILAEINFTEIYSSSFLSKED
ncbi:MAG: methyltransferase domain-containing protein, partial [Candidatus Hodarchaeota archaeon]